MVSEKIKKFKEAASAGRAIVVCDFDHTLTTADSRASLSSVGRSLGEDSTFFDAHGEIFRQFSRLILMGEEYRDELKVWWKRQMQLFVTHEVPESQFGIAAASGFFRLRNGSERLFAFCRSRDIPMYILSAGSGDAITAMLRQKRLLTDNVFVLSNFLQFENGMPVSCSADVYPYGKYDYLKSRIETPYDFSLVFGNNDEDMQVTDGDRRISVCFGESEFADICFNKETDIEYIMNNLEL